MTTRSRKQLFTPATASELRPVHPNSVDFPVAISVPESPHAGPADPGNVEDVDGAKRPEFLTTKQIADMFGRQPRTVRNWVTRGLLKPRRIGRSVFFLLSDIDAIDR